MSKPHRTTTHQFVLFFSSPSSFFLFACSLPCTLWLPNRSHQETALRRAASILLDTKSEGGQPRRSRRSGRGATKTRGRGSTRQTSPSSASSAIAPGARGFASAGLRGSASVSGAMMAQSVPASAPSPSHASSANGGGSDATSTRRPKLKSKVFTERVLSLERTGFRGVHQIEPHV